MRFTAFEVAEIISQARIGKPMVPTEKSMSRTHDSSVEPGR